MKIHFMKSKISKPNNRQKQKDKRKAGENHQKSPINLDILNCKKYIKINDKSILSISFKILEYCTYLLIIKNLIQNKVMPNEIQTRLAENIKRIRKEQKITQFELAERANISEAMVKSIEICHSWPSEKTLLQISLALKTDVSHFFMPVSSSLSINDEYKSELKYTIKKKYCEFLDDVMKELC